MGYQVGLCHVHLSRSLDLRSQARNDVGDMNLGDHAVRGGWAHLTRVSTGGRRRTSQCPAVKNLPCNARRHGVNPGSED